MIKKLKAFLVDNLILSAVLAMILAVVVCLGWKATLTSVVATIPAINRMAEPYSNKTDYAKNTYEDNRFEYTPLGVIYHAPTGTDAGPFQYLFTDEFYFSWETVARYIGDNGKYGYVNKDGALLTEPIFIDAAEFEDGTASITVSN